MIKPNATRNATQITQQMTKIASHSYQRKIMSFLVSVMSNTNNTYINCIQINIMRSKTSTAHLIQHMNDNNIDIALIQEPHTNNGTVLRFSLSHKQFYDRNTNRPKSAIIIANNLINGVLISSYTNDWLTLCTISFSGKNFCLISAYLSPNSDLNTFKSQLNHIKSAINNIKVDYFVISVDSNAHSRVWFDLNNDNRGEEILDFISENNLILLNNNKNIPTFETIRGQTVCKSSIDLTLISMNAIRRVNDWHVLSEDSQSDHKFIEFKFNETTEKIQFKTTLKYNTKTANWESLMIHMTPYINQFNSSLQLNPNAYQINELVNSFMYKLTEICDKNIRRHDINKVKKKANKWWTPDLQSLRQQVNTSRRRFQRCRTNSLKDALKDTYISLKTHYKKVISEEKIKSWNHFIAETTRDNP